MTRLWPTPNSDDTGTGRNDGDAAGPSAEATGEVDARGAPLGLTAEPQPAATSVTDRTKAAATGADRGTGTCMAVAYGRSITPAF